MAQITRTSQAEWSGDLRTGNGTIVTESGVLSDTPYNFEMRFEDEHGTNPEELIAAAHAACFNMAFAGALKKKGYLAANLSTRAVCVMEPKEEGGWKIARMQLDVLGRVPGIDQQTFQQIAKEAHDGCPVTNLLKHGLEIEMEADLVEHELSRTT